MNAALPNAMVIFLERPVVEALGWALLHFLWQGAAVAALCAVVLLALRRAAPGSRYLVACAGMLLMAACPLATLTWTWPPSTRSAAIASAGDIPRDFTGAQGVAGGPYPATPEAPTVERVRPTDEKANAAAIVAQADHASRPASADFAGRLRPALPWIVGGWLLGVMALGLRLGVGWLRVQRLRRRQIRPAAAEWQTALRRLAALLRVSRPVTLVESALVEVPTVIGWLRPAILLPASVLMGLTPRQLEAILAHELAHIRRHDYLVNLVQTALEALLFYHPAVWWLSRVIRAEREACCDDVAVEVVNDKLDYARALASLEELRGRPRLAVAAADGPLAYRIRRLVGAPCPQDNRSAWWVVAAVAAGVLAMFAMQGRPTLQAEGPTEPIAEKPADPPVPPGGNAPDSDAPDGIARDGDWGPESDGLRCRLVAVPTSTDDDAPDAKKSVDQFAGGDAVAFAVVLKNVGEKPLTLLGVRNDSAEGALNTGFLGPYLFEFEFTDPAGTPLPRPRTELLGGLLELSGASTHVVEPGASLTILLRPARFMAPMECKLPAGEYRARVRYRGPSAAILAAIARHWPDKPQGKAWSGDVTSNEVAFTVADGAKDDLELVWGEAKDSLQAAVEFRPLPGAVAPDDPAGTVPLNSVLSPVFHLKNVSKEAITLTSETWRQDDQLTVTDEAGAEQKVSGAWYTGLAIRGRWTLRPGEVAELKAADLAIAADEAALQAIEHPVGKWFIAVPGKYLCRYSLHIGSIQSRDEKGNVVVPGKEDWQAALSTGQTPLVVRARTPEDDERVRVPTFTGKIEFVGPEGGPIEAGTFHVRTLTQRAPAAEYQIHAGPIDVANCVAQSMAINVRAPGYEEAYFNDVQFTPDETRRIELKPAAPTRFRLVSAADGTPIAGARVRHFSKSCAKASAGPYPMQGIEGRVWGVSQADGRFVLDSLQRVDPYYPDLGDAVYYLYIDSAEFAPRFLGPVRAGQELGDVTLGPFLEVRGEVRGTPEELDRFAAEWDQPFEMTNDNPVSAWLYAVSQKLETQREGDLLRFQLTGLRPGKLRIIANFGPNPHHVQHTYARRDPKGSDIVVEMELTESVLDLVVTPQSGRRVEEE